MSAPGLIHGWGRRGTALPPFDFAALAALGVPLARLTADSRAVRAGDVFVAYPGERSDGRGFIDRAVEAGAAAVLWEKTGFAWDPGWRVPNLGIDQLKEQAGSTAIRRRRCG